MDDLKVSHQEEGREGAFFIEQDGKRVGEMAYVNTSPDVVTIIHTQVGPELRGRGAGLLLVEAGVKWAREHHKQVIPQCPFARATIEKHPELQDVLKK